MDFTWADWLIVIVLAISSLISFKRGFVKEALSLGIWLIAFIVASTFSPLLAPILAQYIDIPSVQQMTAFAILFVLTLLTGSGLNYLLSTLIKVSGLTGTDRLLGMLFGLLRGLIIIMVLLIYVPKFVPVTQDGWWQRSILIPHLVKFEGHFTDLTHSLYISLKELV